MHWESFRFSGDYSDLFVSGCECDLLFSELSVCKVCYKRLIFKKASDHLQELKTELKGIFKDREIPRTKRLLRIENDSEETVAAPCRGKASKCLQFLIEMQLAYTLTSDSLLVLVLICWTLRVLLRDIFYCWYVTAVYTVEGHICCYRLEVSFWVHFESNSPKQYTFLVFY